MKIKYLVIRFSSIGDIVLTTPVVRGLKQQVEGAEVHFVTKKKHASIVNSNPFIDKVHIFNENFSDLLNELDAEQFDYIIDLHQNIRSKRIKTRLKIPAFTFQKLNIQKYLLVNFKINRLPEKHIVDRYMETLSVFDIKDDGKGLDFFIPDKEAFNFAELPDKFQKEYIAFALAGTYFTKRLPSEKIIEICNGIDFPVILLGGKNEKEEAQKIVEKTNGNVINLSGIINLNQSSSLVKNANLVLTNDTGLMHIAAAFKKKILSFWGNTVPEFGMIPYQPHPNSKIMEVKNLKCRPCSKLGYSKCPKKHFKCMKNLDSSLAIEWINKNFN